MGNLGIEVEIEAEHYRVPTTTPFAEDTEHASYDRRQSSPTGALFAGSTGRCKDFAGWFCGKASSVHLFWHGFDLAVTRFSGARAPRETESRSPLREAYSHELISFGFWPGDQKVPEPTFYSYTAPEPAGLAEQRLRPGAASWQQPYGESHFALLPYEAVRASEDPRKTLLDFLQSAYDAGALLAGWDRDSLRSAWYPPPTAGL